MTLPHLRSLSNPIVDAMIKILVSLGSILSYHLSPSFCFIKTYNKSTFMVCILSQASNFSLFWQPVFLLKYLSLLDLLLEWLSNQGWGLFQCKAFCYVPQVEFLDHKYSFQLTAMGCVCTNPRAKCLPGMFIHFGLKRTGKKNWFMNRQATKNPL